MNGLDEQPGSWNRQAYMSERRRQLVERYRQMLGGRCAVCDTTENLEFDHIDPTTKVMDIGRAVTQWGHAKIVEELAKCQLLCHQHHVEKSRAGRESGGRNKIIDPPHGTWAKYTNDKCRCPECQTWLRDYKKKLVDARGNPR